MMLPFFCRLALCLLLSAPTCLVFAAPSGLTIVTGQGTIQTDAATARHDFGVRLMSDQSPIEYTFILRNESAAPIIVDRLQSSCGCTTAFFADEQALPLTVGPGGLVPVRVSIAPHRLAPGPVQKSVWVFTHGVSEASLVLEITGTLQEEAAPIALKAPSAAVQPPAPVPQVGQAAPAFPLTDTRGKPFALASTQGHPVALFFFCGCPWCAEVAKAWGQAQRSRRLPALGQTVIVFTGSGAAAQAFAVRSGLNMKQTILLPDPDSAVTERVYKLNSCPRAFALDPAGMIRYLNNQPDDLPRVGPAKTIVSRTLTALRR